MKKKEYCLIIIGMQFFLLCSCLDVFLDKKERIIGDIYFVRQNGSEQSFIGQNIGDGNFSILIQGNIKEVIGSKTSLFGKTSRSLSRYIGFLTGARM